MYKYDLVLLYRKKLKSTSQYIYETLFLNGENNDVTIVALGKAWNLHRVYLCQVITSAIVRILFTISIDYLQPIKNNSVVPATSRKGKILYLLQSGYFHGMFTGGWKESQQQTIHIDIPDENIDYEGQCKMRTSYYDNLSFDLQPLVFLRTGIPYYILSTRVALYV